MERDYNGKPLTIRSLAGLTATILAGVAAMGAIFSFFIIPGVIQATRLVIIEEINRHERGTHLGSVTSKELGLTLQMVNMRLERIESALLIVPPKSPK